jgi:circadian clock protein KaiB
MKATRTTRTNTRKKNLKAVRQVWSLRLYIAGHTSRSIAAIANLQKVCDQNPGKCRVEVVDLLKDPQLAAGDQIVALPTLVRRMPPPLKRIVGDLSDLQRIIVGLDFRSGGARNENSAP